MKFWDRLAAKISCSPCDCPKLTTFDTKVDNLQWDSFVKPMGASPKVVNFEESHGGHWIFGAKRSQNFIFWIYHVPIVLTRLTDHIFDIGSQSWDIWHPSPPQVGKFRLWFPKGIPLVGRPPDPGQRPGIRGFSSISELRRTLMTCHDIGKRRILRRIHFWNLETRLRPSSWWKMEKSIKIFEFSKKLSTLARVESGTTLTPTVTLIEGWFHVSVAVSG